MRSPVSSRLCLVFQEALEGAVFGGVVVDAVLPAVPDDGEPGAGKDANGVWVVVASGSGALVEVGGPRVGSAGVAGELADGVAQLFVAGPTEADGAYFAGLAGRGGDTGQAHQRLGGGELGAAVADFGEQSGSADAAGAGQAGEDVRVDVCGQLGLDLGGEGLDLFEQAGERGVRVGVGAGKTAGCAGEPGVQDCGVDLAGVADTRKPLAQPGWAEPVGLVLGGEAGQKRQADWAVDVGEQSDRAGKRGAQV